MMKTMIKNEHAKTTGVPVPLPPSSRFNLLVGAASTTRDRALALLATVAVSQAQRRHLWRKGKTSMLVGSVQQAVKTKTVAHAYHVHQWEDDTQVERPDEEGNEDEEELGKEGDEK